MGANTNTLQQLECNADSISTDEIVQRVLDVTAHACNDNDSETFIDNETLWRELRHRDRGRRAAALAVVDACSALAHLRAAKYEQTYFDARYSVLACDLLDRDLADPDPDLSAAARHVWDAVTMLQSMRDDLFGSAEHSAWKRDMRVEIVKRLAHARRALRKEMVANDGGDHV